jgi:hypothetical protein
MSDDSDKARPTEGALLVEYAQVVNNFRTLTDIRFKLLGFLPIASAVPVIVAMSKGDLASIAMLMLGLFGLAATTGLALYNSRNDQLYDDLVGRAAALERRLGIAYGSFANRPRSWLKLNLPVVRLKVGHREAVATIYAASVALWLSLIFATLLNLFGRPSSGYGTQALALLLAIASTWWGYRAIEERQERRSDELRERAHDAYRFLVPQKRKEGEGVDAVDALGDTDFLRLCALLAGAKQGDVPEVKQKEMQEANASAKTDKKDKLTKSGIWEQTKARADFYKTHPDDLLKAPAEERAAHTVALLTDLSPRWIHDSGEDRRGAIAKADAKKAAGAEPWWEVPRVVQAALMLALLVTVVSFLFPPGTLTLPADGAVQSAPSKPGTTEAVTKAAIEPAHAISIPALVVGLFLVGTGAGLLLLAKGRMSAVVSGLSLVTLGSVFSGAAIFKEIKLDSLVTVEVAVPKPEPASANVESIGSVEKFRLGSSDSLEGEMDDHVYRSLAQRWIANRVKGRDGTLMFVGSTDEVPLSKAGQTRYEGNVGLARARAETVKYRFVKAVEHLAPKDVPHPGKMLVLVSGPQQLKDPGKDVRRDGTAEYRRVDIWAFWEAALPRTETPKP